MSADTGTSSGEVWTYRPVAGYVDATPAVADVDGDGIPDLVMATTGGTVVALDANGHVKWKYNIHSIISNPVAVGGDPLRVWVLTNAGGVWCLDARSGRKLWSYSLPGGFPWGMTAPVVADLDGDGKTEVIVADQTGHLRALRSDGSLLWSTDHREGFITAPAVADLNGDGRKEILLGSHGELLVCFSAKGKMLWHNPGNSSGGSPLVTDLQGDGRPEILAGDKKGFTVTDNGGTLLWHQEMPAPVHDAVAAGDLNGDGSREIVIVDLRGNVTCLTAKGKLLWKAKVSARSRRPPLLTDIDGDGRTEVIVGGYSRALSIFNDKGILKEEIPLNGGMNSMPLLIDFHHNGHPLLICANTSEVIALDILKGKSPIENIPLQQYRLNAARTGAYNAGEVKPATGIAKVSYGSLHTGIDRYTVTVRNPLKRPLSLELSLQKEGEAPVTRILHSSDTLFSLSLPYSIPGDMPLTLRFSYRLTEKGKLLASRERSFYLTPFARDLLDLEDLLTRTRENIVRLTEKNVVSQRLPHLEQEAADLREKRQFTGALSPLELAALRTRFATALTEAARLEALTRAAAEAGNRLAAYGANPWAPFGGTEELVEGRTPPPQLTVEAFGGEKESAAFNVANYSDHTVTVRVEPDNLRRGDSVVSFRRVLDFHEVVAVPTHSLDMSADALPEIGQGRTIVIAPWEVRQVWINVDASQLTPGEWSCPIRLRTLEVAPAGDSVSLNVKVWPVSLTPKDPLRLCQWGYVESSILKDMVDEALRDQVEHGTNVFVDGGFMPRATFDENGNLTGEIDFTAHDEYIHRYAPHGIILFGGYQGALKGPAKMFSPPWTKAYKTWIRAWRDHLLAMGLTYDDFAFYPIDEPGLRDGQVEEVVKLARPIKEVDPRLKIYADPVSRTTMTGLKKMAPYIDIWCPNRSGYLLHEGGDKLDFIKSTGKTVWTYECLGDVKHRSPLGYYRSQSWLVWWHGLTGIGFWSYCTSQHDPWYVPKGGQDYLLIYQGNGVVTSKRWEAVRDGKEDYNMLVQLQQLVKDPPPGADPAVLEQARAFLKERTAVIASYCGLDKDGTLPGTGGLPEVRKVEDRRWKTLQETRRELATLLMTLTNPSGEH